MGAVMFLSLYLAFSMIVLFVLLALGILVLLIAKLMHKERVADISTCFLLWTVFPFALPAKAKEKGFITKKIYSWILVLLSPVFILIYVFWGIVASVDRPSPDEERAFTSREEIVAITGIETFPTFEQQKYKKNGWDGTNYAEYKFAYEEDVELLFAEIEARLADEGNVFWSAHSLKEEDKEFFGGDNVYVCERGWCESPEGVGHDNRQVRIAIGKKRFIVRDEACRAWNLDYYSSPDSLSVLTGVDFPSYDIVNLSYFGQSIDPSWDATLLLDKRPSKAFIQSLRSSELWTREEDGKYHFRCTDRGGRDLWEDVFVDPDSRLVKLSVSTY